MIDDIDWSIYLPILGADKRIGWSIRRSVPFSTHRSSKNECIVHCRQMMLIKDISTVLLKSVSNCRPIATNTSIDRHKEKWTIFIAMHFAHSPCSFGSFGSLGRWNRRREKIAYSCAHRAYEFGRTMKWNYGAFIVIVITHQPPSRKNNTKKNRNNLDLCSAFHYFIHADFALDKRIWII